MPVPSRPAYSWTGPTVELPVVTGRRPWSFALPLAALLLVAAGIGLGAGLAGAGPGSDPVATGAGRPSGPPATGSPSVTATPARSPAASVRPAPPASPGTAAPSASPTGSIASMDGSWPAGKAGSVQWAYPDFAQAASLRFNGSARLAGNRIELARGRTSAGSVWSTTPVDPGRSLVTGFTFQINKVTDGIAFVMRSQSPQALGATGAGLGYGARPGSRDPAITPSVAIEFDTWDNSRDGFDPPGQHVAVTTNGDITRHLIWRDPQFSLVGDHCVEVIVTYDAGRRLLAVRVAAGPVQPAETAISPAVPPLWEYPIDLVSVLGAGPALVGFTGGTGLTTIPDPLETVYRWSYAQLG